MKVLKLTIVAYDNVEMYLIINDGRQFEKAKEVIKECETAWLEKDEFCDNFDDFCDYYEYRLTEEHVKFEYINADEEMELL